MFNNFNNFQQPQMPGYGYATQPVKVPKPTNPLTPEELALLKQKAPGFTLTVTPVEAAQAVCTHRNENGDTLTTNSDGTCTCTLCGTTFRPVQATPEKVEQAFQVVVDCLETSKIMYLDIPDEVARGFYQMIPFLKKGPQLYKIAADMYHKYQNGVLMPNQNYSGSAAMLFNAMFSPNMGMGMQVPYGQPGMAPMGVAPNMNQPAQDVTMGAANGNANPFDVGSAPAMDAARTVVDNAKYSL